MKTNILFRLFSNYRKSDTNLSFKNYIKKELGNDWVNQIAKNSGKSTNNVANEVKYLTTLNNYINHDNVFLIKTYLTNDTNQNSK